MCQKRWFTSANDLDNDFVEIGDHFYPLQKQMITIANDVAVGVEICEDLWMPVPPSSELAMLGANIIVNLSASNELIGKHAYRKQLVAQQSARCICGYVYASSGFGESTTDLVFSGSALIAENGVILAESKRFSLDEQLIISDIDVEYLYHDRLVSTSFSEGCLAKDTDRGFELEFILPEYRKETANMRCEEIFQIQTAGLAKRIVHAHAKTAVVGISGGLDSTLALLVTVMTFDLLKIPRNRIIGITMPGFGTTGRLS